MKFRAKMRDFDIDKIGRKAPQAPPAAGFFEEFTHATLLEIERRRAFRVRLRRVVISSLSSAAVVAAVLWGNWSGAGVASDVAGDFSYEISYVEGEFNEKLESYVGEFSDEEIEDILSETESDGLFFSNL